MDWGRSGESPQAVRGREARGTSLAAPGPPVGDVPDSTYMDSELIGRLREAAAAFNRGDPEPLVALLHPDLEWRGFARGYLWRRHTPT